MGKVKVRSYPVLELMCGQQRLAAVENLPELLCNIEEYGCGVPLVITPRMEIVLGCEKLLALCASGNSHARCVWREDLTAEQAAGMEDLHRRELSGEWEWDVLMDEAAELLGNPAALVI